MKTRPTVVEHVKYRRFIVSHRRLLKTVVKHRAVLLKTRATVLEHRGFSAVDS